MLSQITLVSLDYNNKVNIRSCTGVLVSDVTTHTTNILANLSLDFDPGDKVFFDPNTSVPRFKFNEYGKDKDLSRTIKSDRSTIYVVDVNKLVSEMNDYRITLGSLMKFPKSALGKFSNHGTPSDVYIRTDDYINICKHISSFAGVSYTKDQYYYTSYTNLITNNYENIEKVANLVGIQKIMDNDTCLSVINTGNTVLSDSIYNELEKMLKSSNHEDTALAMEIMANCDYSKSELRTVLLLNRFHSNMKSSKNWNHVNFKSLLKYFDKYKWDSSSIDFAISIIETTKPDMADKDSRIHLAKLSVLDYLQGLLPTSIISIEDVVISDISKYLGEQG